MPNKSLRLIVSVWVMNTTRTAQKHTGKSMLMLKTWMTQANHHA